MNIIKSILNLFHKKKQEDLSWRLCPKCGEYMRPTNVIVNGNKTDIEGWTCTGCGSSIVNMNR